MPFTEKFKPKKKPIMILGTSSGVGKSITVTAICRILRDKGDLPIPFKGQNMSNNAWIDNDGGEMAYSQALQAIAAGVTPSSEMNPILLKPQGESISEVIHLGKSVGTTSARNYYKNWYESGWIVIKKAINKISKKYDTCRLIIEGAGSPVEMNLIHRDLTNLKIAKYLNANCILVADIEKGGVFAQIVGTLELMNEEEKKLIKGIIINRFRGDITLFEEGKKWIEKKTNIPILGILPSMKDKFPPEDSLDLLDNISSQKSPELNVGIIKFPSISNFSDLDPLVNDELLKLNWIKNKQELNDFDLIILPGSKQTIKDLLFLYETGLINNIKKYSQSKGNIFGICGGLQMLGEYLEDPFAKEYYKKINSKIIKGVGVFPLRTEFLNKKITKQFKGDSIWPCQTNINGFEMHHGKTNLVENYQAQRIYSIFKQDNIGWYKENDIGGTSAGIYIHGIFENDLWRKSYLNLLKEKKGIKILDKKDKPYKIKQDTIINNLANQFKKSIKFSSIIN